mmetsp:Transcript_12652/g.41708  ORF Transcript_12652/g.41708 Transcript_12652/m.41708 type:complete len:203 (-) Transcript_12652:1102-1710(-)
MGGGVRGGVRADVRGRGSDAEHLHTITAEGARVQSARGESAGHGEGHGVRRARDGGRAGVRQVRAVLGARRERRPPLLQQPLRLGDGSGAHPSYVSGFVDITFFRLRRLFVVAGGCFGRGSAQLSGPEGDDIGLGASGGRDSVQHLSAGVHVGAADGAFVRAVRGVRADARGALDGPAPAIGAGAAPRASRERRHQLHVRGW